MKSKLKQKLLTMSWAFKLAWRINKKTLVFWYGMSIFLAVFPAVSLIFNRNIISTISDFLTTGAGELSDAIYSIVMLGITLTVIGLSGRINQDLVYMMMYDSYYLGMEEVLMDKKQNLDLKYLLDKEVRDECDALISRCGSLNDFISSSCMLISRIVSIVSLLLVALTASPVIFFTAIVYIVFTLIFNAVSIDKAMGRYEVFKRQERVAAYYQRLPNTPGLAKEIRIYESKKDILDQWEDAHSKVELHNKKERTLVEARAFISGLVFYLFVVCVVIYSIFRVASGEMKADVFLMIYSLSNSLSASINGTTRGFMEASRGLFELVRQKNFVENAIERHDIENPRQIDETCENVYEFKNVGFSYIDGKPVLKNINLKIKAGETVALVGYNGAGKTTLTNLMLNKYFPTEGELLFYGHPISEYAYDDIKKQSGAFFQNFFTFHASVRDNVGFGDVDRIDDKEKIINSIKAGGAEGVVKKLPKGLDNWLRKDAIKEGAALSGGEKQRIAVSRAHMCDRPIMIFDEPAAALDPIAEMEQFFRIKEKAKGKTTILISHRIGFARLADRIIVMDKGEIVEDGTHDELMKLGGTYAYFFCEQAKWYDDYKGGAAHE